MSKEQSPLTVANVAINQTKINVFRDGTLKDYPVFVMQRIAAHQADSVLFANDLNFKGYTLTPRMHFEYLMHSLTKRNRYAPYSKPKNSEHVEFIQNILSVSRIKAEEYLSILSEDALKEVLEIKKVFLENG